MIRGCRAVFQICFQPYPDSNVASEDGWILGISAIVSGRGSHRARLLATRQFNIINRARDYYINNRLIGASHFDN